MSGKLRFFHRSFVRLLFRAVVERDLGHGAGDQMVAEAPAWMSFR
jgi:hypothetical protein